MSQKQILTRYSQTTNVEQKNVGTSQYVAGQKVEDDIRPYSFTEWLRRNIGIIPGKERLQYDQYLVAWYTARDYDKTQVAVKVKEDYIALLQQLTVAFQSEAEEVFATNINWDDDLELEQIIPFYTRKLKEIAIYLINKREAIKKSKLKYNLSGATAALESLFYEYLLNSFTKNKLVANEYTTNISSLSTLNAIPELSAAAKTFQIEIEEIYDDSVYFDRDPSINSTQYFDLSSESIVDYLSTKDINSSQIEWLYNTGVSQLCADNPLLWTVDSVLNQYKNGIPVSALDTYNSSVLNDYTRIALTEKYLGRDQNIISGGYYSLWEQTVDYPFQAGNNWMYWVSGEFIEENDTSQTIDPLMLTATNLIQSGAVAGDAYTNSDVIFMTRNHSTSGAWLQLSKTDTVEETLSADLPHGDTIFSFPLPGYGVSGADIEWTGKGLTNINTEYNSLDDKEKAAVNNIYWNTFVSSASTMTPLSIHETSLIDTGAFAGIKYDEADKIITRTQLHDLVPNNVYTGTQNYAWLYKMERTDIPISEGSNKIYWPVSRVDGALPVSMLSAQCTELPLSTININNEFLGAVAGARVDLADQIYMYDSYNNGNVVNAAWLSGSPNVNPNTIGSGLVSGASQPGVCFKVNPGSSVEFIWEDNNTNSNEVFTHFKHQRDCQYLKQDLISLFFKKIEQNETGINYNQWANCTCRAIMYSPFGHPGSTFDDFNRVSDVITTITDPLCAFSIETWRDSLGNGYKTSSEFGWFQLTGDLIEPDIGWSDGRWVTYSGDDFILSSDRLYSYTRTNIMRGKNTTSAPYFIAKYQFTIPRCEWIEMVFIPQESKWVSTDKPATLIFKPGNYYDYMHTTNVITLTSMSIAIQDRPSYALPDFTSSSMTSNITSNGLTTETMIISTPVWSTSGSPVVPYIDYYEITETEIPQFQPGVPLFVSGSFDNTDLWQLSTSVTAISTEVTDFTRFVMPPINFTMNVELSGWNYESYTYDRTSPGARPFWAKGYDSASAETKFKGIDVWGGSIKVVDEYNIISQPDFADVTLDMDTFLKYHRQPSNTLRWIQPITLHHEVTTANWKDLVIDTSATSNLSAMLRNNISELVVSGTDRSSSLVFDVIEDEHLFINYFATNAFTWRQTITDSSLGLPPTGGVWTPIVSGALVKPLTPYAYLTNRHFPTIASAPYTGNLYTVKDSGGYMIPRMLGASTFLSKNRTHELNTVDTGIIYSNNPNDRIFSDLNTYLSDYGLSNTIQTAPVSSLYVDISWLKYSPTTWSRAGMPKATRDHQDFMPYQTKYETKKTSDSGVRRQSDKYDPWYRDQDNTWENESDWPANFRGEFDITGWYSQFIPSGSQVYQWKTDVFSNEYALMKDIKDKSIYDKRLTQGALWTRDLRNKTRPAIESLSDVFDKFTAVNSSLVGGLSSQIYDFDIWFDTLMLHIPNHILIAKLNFDYEENLIYAIADNIHIISLCDGLAGGIWLFEEDKYVIVNTLHEKNDYYYPIFYRIDLETNVMQVVYNGEDDTTLQTMSAVALTGVELPVFTYNSDTQLFNIAFIGYSSIHEGMYFTTININNYGQVYELKNFQVITPT